MTKEKMFHVVDLRGERPERTLSEKEMYSYLDHLEKESGRNREVHALSFEELLNYYAEDYWMDVVRVNVH